MGSRTGASRIRAGAGCAAVALALLHAAGAGAQSTKMPSTLRFGSGLWDVPVASVLPHLAVTGTYSGFSLDVDGDVVVDEAGDAVGTGPPVEGWKSDGSLAVGLLDRLEVGATFQSFGGEDGGGTMAGGFGRLLLLRPGRSGGFGLAGGLRVVSAPSFEGAEPDVEFQPGRLGFPDRRLRESFAGKGDVNTVWSPYVVASAVLPGFESWLLPTHDVTLTLGRGGGIFSGGEDLEDWYGPDSSGGWFFGAAVHARLTETAVVNVVGDYNGFDVNLGAQVDVGGVRIGGFVLGLNHSEDAGRYRSRKAGLLASVAFCPTLGGLCRPELLERSEPDTVRIPAPPPDTVLLERAPAPEAPVGSPLTLCLATGEAVRVRVTARGDTVVGRPGVPLEELRPGFAFAGDYAEGRAWFTAEAPIEHQGRSYRRSGEETRLECGEIERVGEHRGVPLFAGRGGVPPPPVLWIPVRPGLWLPYRPAPRGPPDRGG